MNLIGQQDVSTTSYKKAAVIMFDNTNTVPVMRAYKPVAEEVVEA